MGKTLIINGASVPNPLAQLTIADAEQILAEYYSANTSINSSEKNALETLVETIVNAGLWGKVRSFYPMLGDNANDLLLDAKNVSAENYIKQNLTDRGATLSVTQRNFLSTSGGDKTTSTDMTRLDIKRYGATFIFAHNWATTDAAVLKYPSTPIVEERFAYGGYAYPRMTVSNTTFPTSSSDGGNQYSYKSRKLIYSLDATTAAIYIDGALYKSAAISVNDDIISKIQQVFYTMPYISFFAQTEVLSSDELTAFYSAIDTFATSLNKVTPV